MKKNYAGKWLAVSGASLIVTILIITWFVTRPLAPPLAAEPRDEVENFAAADRALQAEAAPTAPDAKRIAGARPGLAQPQAFAQFNDWFARYQEQTDAAARAQLQSEGEALAQQRREAMARLIEEDPQAALQAALSYSERQQLPRTIAERIEQPVSGRGNLEVLGILPEGEDQAPGIVRNAEIGGQRYRAFVYGRRLSQVTTMSIPLHGIAVGDALALNESPVRVLDNAEAVARAAEIAP